jgi:hypothetical protein
MSLSHDLARMNDEQLREALRVLATKILVSGGGSRNFDNWMQPVNHAFHAGGWTKERLREFKRMYRHEFQKAKAAMQPAQEGVEHD